MLSKSYFIGVDVGTGSARAGIFDAEGRMLSSASKKIKMFRPQTDYVEQSSDDIWQSCIYSVRTAMQEAGIAPEEVKGIGFDATCSLVAIDADGKPVTVSPSGNNDQNVIVWMDHRATDQAARINAGKHDVLRYVGGQISPEMETPKLLWLKENMPETWERTALFFDLPDFLTWKATNSETRSLCSCVCKWTYLGYDRKWDQDYFDAIGLGDLVDGDARRIGADIADVGQPQGKGLSALAADELGLITGTPVGVSMIDAHAGGIGVLGAQVDTEESIDFDQRLALIGGTSSCHMAVAPEARFIDGVWGPYHSAMVPGLWLTEGGQSTTGALVDHVIFNHAAAPALNEEAEKAGKTIYQLLNERLGAMAGSFEEIPYLTKALHVLPYFHGNRSPRANPHLTGMFSGLKLSATADDLALQYLATVQAIALGTRHIIDEMNQAGYRISTIMACGGGTKNPVFLQAHADATECRVVLSQEPEAVLLGSAMLGATASGHFDSLAVVMQSMSRAGRVINPALDKTADFYAGKYAVFHELYNDQMKYQRLMNNDV